MRLPASTTFQSFVWYSNYVFRSKVSATAEVEDAKDGKQHKKGTNAKASKNAAKNHTGTSDKKNKESKTGNEATTPKTGKTGKGKQKAKSGWSVSWSYMCCLSGSFCWCLCITCLCQPIHNPAPLEAYLSLSSWGCTSLPSEAFDSQLQCQSIHAMRVYIMSPALDVDLCDIYIYAGGGNQVYFVTGCHWH